MDNKQLLSLIKSSVKEKSLKGMETGILKYFVSFWMLDHGSAFYVLAQNFVGFAAT